MPQTWIGLAGSGTQHRVHVVAYMHVLLQSVGKGTSRGVRTSVSILFCANRPVLLPQTSMGVRCPSYEYLTVASLVPLAQNEEGAQPWSAAHMCIVSLRTHLDDYSRQTAVEPALAVS